MAAQPSFPHFDPAIAETFVTTSAHATGLPGYLGIRFVEMTPGRLVATMTVRDELLTPLKSLHGGGMAGGLSRAVQALVFKSPAGLAAVVRQLERGVRTRADAAVKDLEARGVSMVGAVERQLAKASTAVLRRFSAVTHDEVDALTQR